MTADELRKLAEIAGLKLSSVGELLQSGSRYYHGNSKNRQIIPTYEWQPHIRIEQAMMVAEALVKNDIARIFQLEFRRSYPLWDCTFYWMKDNKCITRLGNTPAEAICAAALAAAKDV